MEKLKVKKIITFIITATIILTGCSSEKTDAYNTSQQTSKDINTNSSLLQSIDTTKSQFKKGYYDYQGTINSNIPIQLSIYPLEKDIVGTYFYESQKKEIKLKGKSGEKDIILYEYDESGKNTGVFKGTMSTVDKIEGTWLSVDGKKSYPFTLSLKSSLPGVEYGKRYSVAVGAVSDQDVESFVSKIQEYIINGNKEQLATQVTYPITAKINGKVTIIHTKDEFIKNYDQIFDSNYKQVISKAYTKYLFANWQGIMLGGGQYNMWIHNSAVSNADTSKLMIKAINN